MRVTVIGCGSIGRRHIKNLLALGCDVGAWDLCPEALQAALSLDARLHAARPGAPCEAVVIATPWDQHLRDVEWAVSSRTPFFIEKPLGSLSQLPRWRVLAASPDLPVHQVGYQLRFHADAQKLHAVTAQSRWIYCAVACDMRQWPGRFYGPPILECSHEIDLALWWGALSTVTHVIATAHAATIYLGTIGLVTMDWRTPHYRREWSVATDEANYRWDCNEPEALDELMYIDELAHFLESIRTQTPTRCTLGDGVRVLEVCAQVEAMTAVRA